MAVGTMTKTTREKIAACAAHGFYYWGDAPGTGQMWATDEIQRWHTVRLHRKTGQAEHSCTRYDGFTDTCTGNRGAVKPYVIPENMAQAALLMGLTEDELVAERPRKAATITQLKTELRKHVPTEVLVAELEKIVARRKPREVVLAGIAHDPSWLVGFTTDELTDALGHGPHDDAVRAELDRRKEAS